MRVLIVSYYFPPKGGAGTQRFAKFCTYLPEHGIEPVVVSVADSEHSVHAPYDDSSLRHGNCRVERVATPAKTPLTLRLRRKLRLHTDEDEWALAAAERCVRLVRDESFDAVLTTLSPYACYRIGAQLQREHSLPWLADLRDPWALDPWRSYRSVAHARWDLAHFRRTLHSADVVVANVPEARRAFIEHGAPAARCVVIPNGFDDADFAGSAPARARRSEPLRLVHVGTFHPTSQPPGMSRNTALRVRNRQFAPLGRTGYYLLHAVARYARQVGHDAARRRLCVHLYGPPDESHAELARELGITDLVQQHGYVHHQEAVAALRSATAAFVPLHDLPDGDRALVVPGKLYEALASECVVLAALPAGDGADLVEALQAGYVVPPTDIDSMATAIAELADRHAKGVDVKGCSREQIAAFSRRALTARLVQALHLATGRVPTADISDPWRDIVSPPRS